jgi:hypothetical protein
MTEGASLKNPKSRAISQAVSRRLLNAEARVGYQGNTRTICVGKVAMAQGFHRVLWHPSIYVIPLILHTHIHSSTIDA